MGRDRLMGEHLAFLDDLRAPQDPLVVAGRLELEGMSCPCPPGGFTAPGEPIQL